MNNTAIIRNQRFKSALSAWVGNSRRFVDVAVNQQLRLFVRDVIRVTPPNSNFSPSKTAGERRIRRELSGIMRESKSPGAEAPSVVHARYRRSNGRVLTKLRTDSYDRRIRVHGLRPYMAEVLKRVGLLASGWNAAARALGLNVPPWIARHGTRGGSYTDVHGFTGRHIRIANRVPYASNVRDLSRRVNAAAENRARQMEKQTADYIFRTAARQSGFRIAA